MTQAQTEQFLALSLALSAERDRERLLSTILDTAMALTNCDAGTLYLLEADGLQFCRMVTRSMGVRQGGHADPITLPPVPLDPAYICAWSLLHRQAINVANVATDARFDFSGPKRYDEMTGYHTQTMLVVPMADDRGELIGVAQLINAQDADGAVVPFAPEAELLVGAIASQAAISITNMKYAEQVTKLLDSLVGALSSAIDQRTPYNANHTKNMAKYGAAFLDWLDETGSPLRFDETKRRTFLFSVWLHDVGKLVVPLEVMDKESRLAARLPLVQERFVKIGLLARIALLEGRMDADRYAETTAQLDAAAALVEQVNAAGFLPDETLAAVDALARRTYTDERGETAPWLTPEEHAALSVRKGTLTDAERAVMEGHVAATARILREVSFPKRFAAAPSWAAGHHELLNGRGYPAHLTAADIPWETRLLTILDVFDALTARDRPYKPPMPAGKAFGILQAMAREGGIDAEILDLFEKSRAWEEHT